VSNAHEILNGTDRCRRLDENEPPTRRGISLQPAAQTHAIVRRAQVRARSGPAVTGDSIHRRASLAQVLPPIGFSDIKVVC
jgi:hypothetical protein